MEMERLLIPQRKTVIPLTPPSFFRNAVILTILIKSSISAGTSV